MHRALHHGRLLRAIGQQRLRRRMVALLRWLLLPWHLDRGELHGLLEEMAPSPDVLSLSSLRGLLYHQLIQASRDLFFVRINN